MRSYTNVPVGLCQFALVNRKVNQVRLYLLLKMSSDGYITYNEHSCAEWAKELLLTSRTVKSALEWLIKQRWITVDGKRCLYHIISYGRLGRRLDVDFGVGFWYDQGVHGDFRALCCGVVISYYLRRKSYFQRRSGAVKGAPITNRTAGERYTQMANGYLAKCLGVSIATAYRIKSLAEAGGYLSSRYGYRYLTNERGEKLSVENGVGYRDYFAQERGRDVIRQGKKHLVEISADHICSHLQCKRKRYKR